MGRLGRERHSDLEAPRMTEKKSPFVVWRTDEQIRIRIRELGQRIQKDSNGAELYVMGVLRGAFIFMADLVRAMDVSLPVQQHVLQGLRLHDNIVKEIETGSTAHRWPARTSWWPRPDPGSSWTTC
jgi:hypothetical protein